MIRAILVIASAAHFVVAQDLIQKNFEQMIDQLTQNLQQTTALETSTQSSLNDIFTASNTLHDYIADNFNTLSGIYPREQIVNLYTQLDAISVFGIFAETITQLTFKGMEPIGWKNTDELPLDPADEIIYSGKEGAEQNISLLQKILDGALSDYYSIAFQAVIQKRFFNPLEKQLLFLSIAFNDFISARKLNTAPLLSQFDQALMDFVTSLEQKAALITKNIYKIPEKILEDNFYKFHEDLLSVYTLLI